MPGGPSTLNAPLDDENRYAKLLPKYKIPKLVIITENFGINLFELA